MEKPDRTEYHRQYYLKRKELKKQKTMKKQTTDPEKIESRENGPVEWLLENSFFHPDYDSKRRRSSRSIRRQQPEPAKAAFSGVSDGTGKRSVRHWRLGYYYSQHCF